MTNNGQVVVEVLDAQVFERGGNFKNDAGEDVAYHIRKQDGRLESAGFAYPYEIRLEEGTKAFAPGRYVLRLDKMLRINNGKASIGKYPVLEPLKA